MKHWHRALATLAVVAGLAGSTSALAADAPTTKLSADTKDIVLKGDAKCTRCHDEADAPALLSIGKTRHGSRADSRAPTCTSCHGESDAHTAKVENGKERPPVDRLFGKSSKTPVAARNEACLTCHQKDAKRSHWEGSVHQSRDVACTSCHQVHTAHDKVRDKRTQPEVCYACHKEQRAQVNKPSHHPIPEGKMGCSDCHNGHGSTGPKLLVRDSVNATCYTCHMEKRGPFVHNHAPVSEDCSICHNPHGTTAENLLKARPPFLCHQCHTPHGGVIASLTSQVPAPTTVGRNSVTVTQGRGCVNCHTQIHGSNNPANSNPNPQFNLR
ncbi:MAG: DmsE family decaheme c-type cytochrome [Telluria sp.]|nr:DmsE family decaheme c-type cytochrome [Telluria sp.]